VTLALELPVAVAFGLRTRQALLAVVLVNLLTNLLLNYLSVLSAHLVDWPHGPTVSIAGIILASETVVVLAEWRLLTWALGEPSRRMLALSACMNAVSALAGIVFWVT
jgi:hypothetical protein